MAQRRREQKARNEAHVKVLEFAQDLTLLADCAPDMEAASDLYRAANRLRLRYATDENKQRLAVLRVLEASALVTAREIVEQTGLKLQTVQEILDDFTSADKGLAFWTTMGGRRNSGRGGTLRYYGLHHQPATPRKK